MPNILFTKEEFAVAHLRVAKEFKTIYMYAAYGFQVTDATIKGKANQNLNGWYTQARINALKKVANQNPPTWGFDCVNLSKSILWGWTGDTSKTKGGAVYAANGVPDTGATGMFNRCIDKSTDFSNIEVGEGLWLEGHWGVYIGDGLAVECTPKWANGVQVTAVLNIGPKVGYNGRFWTKHGKLPWVSYDGSVDIVKQEAISLGSRTIKKGTKGADVKELQEALLSLGYTLPKYGADGDCGNETVKAIKSFQEHNGLLADGMFGAQSLAALQARLIAPEAEPTHTYRVLIDGLSKEQADSLKSSWPQAVVEEM